MTGESMIDGRVGKEKSTGCFMDMCIFLLCNSMRESITTHSMISGTSMTVLLVLFLHFWTIKLAMAMESTTIFCLSLQRSQF